MVEVVIRPRAEADIHTHVRYYESCQPGLGSGFVTCVDDALSAIIAQPRLPTIVYKDIRRKLVHRFPSALFYVVREDRIIVLRVLSQFRNPAIIRRMKDV